MSFDTKTALAGIQSFEDAARVLRDIPELAPIAQRMLEPLLNGHAEPVSPAEQPMRHARVKRPMSAATKKKLRIAAKKRWANKAKSE
jgi:hypothetical protein